MKLSLILIGSLLGMNVFATNGTQLTGVSAAGTALGGTGTASFLSTSEAMFRNPALLNWSGGAVKSWDLEFQGAYVKPTVTGNHAGTDVDSSASGKFVPQIAVAHRLSENLALGFAMLASSGAAVNFTGETSISQPKSDFSIVRLVPSVAYSVMPNFSVGLSPVVSYGEFALNTNASTRSPHGAAAFGVNLGAAYRLNEMFSFGASFVSKTSHTYKDIIDLDEFRNAADNALDPITIDQPMEFGLGVSAQIIPELKLLLDYRNIGWGSAAGYKDFGWKAQNVIAFGAEFGTNPWRVRAGVNYGDSPISDTSGEAGFDIVDIQGHGIFTRSASTLNAFAFPAISRWHFSVGGGYTVTPDLDIDAAFLLSPKSTLTRAGSDLLGAYNFVTTTQIWSVSLGARYRM